MDRRLSSALTAAESAVLADDADALADACEAADALRNILDPAAGNFAASSPPSTRARRGRVVVCASSDADDVTRIGGSDVIARASSSREVAEATRDAWTVAFAPDAARHLEALAELENPTGNARVAVFARAMLPADVSFVAHTGGPAANAGGVASSSNVVEVELALGDGDALASAGSNARGSPSARGGEQTPGEARTTAFASVGVRRGYDAEVDDVATTACDYSREAMTTDANARETLARRVAAVALAAEAEFGEPQRVEGCVVGDEVWVVQTKPRAGRRR